MALTSNQKIRLEAQRVYWRNREARQREADLLQEKNTEAEINRIYAEMEAWADQQINAFYGKYADAEGITLAEAKKRVSKADIEQYEALAKKYVDSRDFSDKANAEMRLYNATMRINRLELLKAQIGLGLVDGANRLDKLEEKSLTDKAVAEYQRQAGILGETLTEADTLKRAKNIVNADFYNATFSDRIWAHADNLRDEIAVQLNQGLIAGVSSRVMAQRLSEKFNVSKSDAHRLAVTEFRRVQTDVAKDAYEANDIDRYEYMAVNPNACPICREIDGEVYYVKDMEVGLNAPPMHPRCHCTTAPYLDEDEYEAWLNYLEQGGSTAEWDAMSADERQQYINGTRAFNEIALDTEPVEPDTRVTAMGTDAPYTPDELAALEEYASGNGMWINQYLRGRGDFGELTDLEKEYLRALDKATSRVINDDRLYRSVDASAIFGDIADGGYENLWTYLLYGKDSFGKGSYADKIRDDIESLIDSTLGKTITEKGFMSTTKDKDIATGFGDFTGSQAPVVLTLDASDITLHGADLGFLDIEDEPQKEVLLHRDIDYRVDSIDIAKDDDGMPFIDIKATILRQDYRA